METGAGVCWWPESVSMRKQPIHPVAATVLLLTAVLILGNVGQLGSAVICIGFDGHVDIESLLKGCCAPGTSSASTEGTLAAGFDSSCGGCTDLQLNYLPFTAQKYHWTQSDVDCGCVPRPPSFSVCGTVRCSVCITETDQHAESLSVLSTVVLLT